MVAQGKTIVVVVRHDGRNELRFDDDGLRVDHQCGWRSVGSGRLHHFAAWAGAASGVGASTDPVVARRIGW